MTRLTYVLNEKGRDSYIYSKQSPVYMYERLLNLASSALAEVRIKLTDWCTSV